MTSPLFQFINTRLKTAEVVSVSVVAGKATESYGDTLLFEAYMKRAQYSGVSSGSTRVPLPSQLGGAMMPGADGDQFYYRGYVLRKAVIAEDFDWSNWDVDTSGLTWVDVTTNPPELQPQKQLDIKFGDEDVMLATTQRATGVFGGRGIDEIIYPAIGGVQLQFTATELL